MKEFKTAEVNEPSVFEPLKFFHNCTFVCGYKKFQICNLGHIHVQRDFDLYVSCSGLLTDKNFLKRTEELICKP